MNLLRKVITPAFAAAAVLGGTSAALAGTSAAAVAAPAHSASAGVAAIPAAAAWYYYSNYPTYRACNSEGFYLEINLEAISSYKCVEKEGYGGAYTVWDLYYHLGHPPGS
jgi:hypothetical protein